MSIDVDRYLTASYRELLEANRGGGLDKSDLATIITVEPLWEQADQISWEYGVEPADLHVTLAFLEHDDEYGLLNLEAVRTTLQNLAYRGGALRGEITGWGCIGPADKPAWVGLLSVLGLAEFRTQLCEELRKQGVHYSIKYDFLPHMTISYGMEPPRQFLDALRGQPLTFQSVVLRVEGDVEIFPFSTTAFVEAARTASGLRRTTTRPGGRNFDPFLHPRNREGKFRNVANKIRDMQVGTQLDVFRFVKRAALPGVTSGRLIRTTTGYVLSVIKQDQAEQYVHSGPMSKDDLIDLIAQAEQNLDFSSLSQDERRELGLPIGTRPGQGLTEEGTLRSERSTPKVDAVVMEQNGGLTVTGTAPENVAGDPDGEHWVLATWSPDEYEHYTLSDKDREYLTSRTHAIAYRTEAGGEPQIEFFKEPSEAIQKFAMLRSKHTPPASVRPNTDIKLEAPATDQPEPPEAPDGDDSGEAAAVESPASASGASSPDLKEPPTGEEEAPDASGDPGGTPVTADDGQERPEETAGETPATSAPESVAVEPRLPEDSAENNSPTGSTQDTDVSPLTSLDGIQPEITADSDDPYSGESPDNEAYQAVQEYAKSNADATIKTPDGDVRRVTLNFEALSGEQAEAALGADFKIEGSAEVLDDTYGAICWPNGLVSLFTEPEPMLTAWARLEKQFSQGGA